MLRFMMVSKLDYWSL